MTRVETGMSYVAKKPCGCVVGAVVDDRDGKFLKKVIGDWVGQGLIIEHVTHEYVRENFSVGPCPHESRQQPLL